MCVHQCAYYKPGKSEGLACRGYLIIERLLRHGRQIDLTQNCSRCRRAARERVSKTVCAACDFRVDGCDFTVDRAAAPCGGLLLLSQLFAQGVISEKDLE